MRRWLEKTLYRGPGWALSAARNRVAPYHIQGAEQWASVFHNARAIEIGGPSPTFDRKGLLPTYGRVATVDNVQYAAETSWQGSVVDGTPLPNGRQIVAEAADLFPLGDAAYDLVLSSHVLEHLANPLKALREWRRIVAPGGFAVVIVPDGRKTWDHARPLTPLAHLIDDERESVPETDSTHLEETLRLTDPAYFEEPWRQDEVFESFRLNRSTRAMHHHVFDPALLSRSLELTGWVTETIQCVWPYHVVAVASRSGDE